MYNRFMRRFCIVFVLLIPMIVCYGEHVSNMYERMAVEVPELTLRGAELTNVVSALIVMSGCLCETNEVRVYARRGALCFSLNPDAISSVESTDDKWWNAKVSGQYKSVKVKDVLLDILKDERRLIVTEDVIMIGPPISHANQDVSMLGIPFASTKPDEDDKAWEKAEKLTLSFVLEWTSKCCLTCSKKDCKWVKKGEGDCAQ